MNDMNCPFKSFDESTYLNLNPDVFEAVKNGSFSSGLAHYICHGFNENRIGVSHEVRKAIQCIISDSPTEPVPSEQLRKRVHGNENLLGFKNFGRIASFNIYSVINSIIELDDHCCILDFGCGCGRIIRWFYKLTSNSRFYGVDIDKDAISWCQLNLSQIAEYETCELPPLPFSNGFFDFVYSISIFTHLPEDMQFAWLEELKRVTKPGGYILLTVQGEELFRSTSETKKRIFQEKGFYYSKGTGTEGLPYFYQTSYHKNDYIYSHWSKFFEIQKIIKNGISNHQDLVLCRRPIFEDTKLIEIPLSKFSLNKLGRLIPPESMSYVGDGDFERIGQKFKCYFIELARLQRNDRVLDVGCGNGRMAIPLTDYLSTKGEYYGFDIVKKGIEWCQNQVSARFSNFHFQHIDVYNKSYNSGGKIKAKDFQFPFQNDYFDFIFLTSVFTHMLPSDTENYMSEISRVLRSGGKCLITFFLLNDESENLIYANRSSLDFKYSIEGCLIVDKKSPERAIAYNEDYVKRLFKDCELKINQPIHYGSWCERDNFLGYQDIIVATKGH